MWPYLLVPLVVTMNPASEALLKEVAAECQTGSLIFSQGDCLAVKVFSRSRFTHVAAVLMEDQQPVVYDSMNGAGVRRSELVDFLRLQTPAEIQILHPVTAYSEAECAAFGAHLKSQLGREYGVRHHLTGRRAKGIHCAEYCTDALLAADRFSIVEPPRVSPGSLHAGLMENQLYRDGGNFVLKAQSTVNRPASNESWCQRNWRESWACTVGCYRQMSRWLLCREKCCGAE